MTEEYNQKIIEKAKLFSNCITQNMRKLESFHNVQFYLFCQQTFLVNEALNCLLLGLNHASIYTTNHLLEKILKVALINKHTAGLDIGDTGFNEKEEEAQKLYDGEKLYNNINHAFKLEILTECEKENLHELRKKFRNPYSHAQTDPFLKNLPPTFGGFMGDISEGIVALQTKNPVPLKEITIPTSILGQYLQRENADRNAFDYFQTVFTIMCNIENKMNKHQFEQMNYNVNE
ncbi:MAG: hypothetical protein QMB39_05960 [Bacteroidales bacterium]